MSNKQNDIIAENMEELKREETSPCCKAKIEITGGGYIGEDIAPILEVCSKCGQVLTSNGHRNRELFNPKTGRRIKQK